MKDRSNYSSTSAMPAGKIIGDYRLGSLLGQGGMADVYYAIDLRLDRPLALKILRSALAADETYRQRFLQEAKAAASLVHPNIVQIYSVGQQDGCHYIAQEYVPGANLRQYLHADRPLTGSNKSLTSGNQSEHSDRQLEIQEVLSILLQVLAAISKAAGAGIVHRDIKPENIMLTPLGEAKVADFGLARLAMNDDPRLTGTGTTLGTPMYMSPEQLEGAQVDIRSDLYSLGGTLFHMLYGRPPFLGSTPLALAMQHVTTDLPELNQLRSTVPASLESLVKRLLSKSPTDRFDTPEQVLDYLHEHRQKDLIGLWPERLVPIPGVALTSNLPMQATVKLQAVMKQKRASFWAARWQYWAWGIPIALLVIFIASYYATYQPPPTAEELFAITEFKNVPQKDSSKSQYEWALLEQSADFQFAKWESIEHYFPKDDSLINRFYAALAQLQLARAHAKVRNDKSAAQCLLKVTDDTQVPNLVRAYAWLERAQLAYSLGALDELRQAVERALQLRASLSRTDLEQLNRAVLSMPEDIALYWGSTGTSQQPLIAPSNKS